MALAIVLGVVSGIVGFIPLFVALRLSRKSTSVSPLSAGLYGLAGFFVSLVVVAVALIVCALNARDLVVPFAIAEIITLVVATSVYVVYKNVLQKKRVKK
jgi:LytS/YehU family sensor histidine kinase